MEYSSRFRRSKPARLCLIVALPIEHGPNLPRDFAEDTKEYG